MEQPLVDMEWIQSTSPQIFPRQTQLEMVPSMQMNSFPWTLP